MSKEMDYFDEMREEFAVAPMGNLELASLYCSRAHNKDPKDLARLRDCAKAIHYLNNEMKEITKRRNA